MSDEQPPIANQQTDEFDLTTSAAARSAASDESPDEGERDNRLSGLLAAALVVVLVIIAILLIPRLVSGGSTAQNNPDTPRSIIGAPPSKSAENMVAVWVKPGTNAQAIFGTAAWRNSNVTAFSGGQYTVTLPPGMSVTEAIRRLKATSGIYDAGRVYSAPPK